MDAGCYPFTSSAHRSIVSLLLGPRRTMWTATKDDACHQMVVTKGKINGFVHSEVVCQLILGPDLSCPLLVSTSGATI